MHRFPDLLSRAVCRAPFRNVVRSLLATLGMLAAGAGLAPDAAAIKWRECPGPPASIYPSTLGATDAPFVHAGHALRISLNASQVAVSGGFSLEPDGNRMEIVLVPPFGAPVALAARAATASSVDSLEIKSVVFRFKNGTPKYFLKFNQMEEYFG